MDDFEDELNLDLTPLIDVIFMLIIFFLMTMSFTMQVTDVNLPQAEGQKADIEGALKLTADRSGAVACFGKILSQAELEALIADNRYRSVLLVIDKNAPAQVLIDVSALVSKRAGEQLQVAVKTEDGD